MTDKRIQDELRSIAVRDEAEAERRSWDVVRTAFVERDVVSWPTRRARPLLALAAALGVLAAALSPPGQALVGSLRDAIGRERVVGIKRSKPALFSLPTRGRLLVNSSKGPWIVQRDGPKRLLGRFREASWSPHGLFVVATRHNELLALDPKGNIRWSLARRDVSSPTWAPSGFRIAYVSRRSLRVVAGDGTGDRPLAARRVLPVAPAWQPAPGHVVAFAAAHGVLVADADEGRVVWRSNAARRVVDLAWSNDGSRLLALDPRALRVFDARGRLIRTRAMPPRASALEIAVPSRGTRLALVRRNATTNRSELVVLDEGRERRLLAGGGTFSDVEWSPDGRWLLVGWKSADQWVFIDSRRPRRLVAVSDISRQFDPSARRPPRFPSLAGWCCR